MAFAETTNGGRGSSVRELHGLDLRVLASSTEESYAGVRVHPQGWTALRYPNAALPGAQPMKTVMLLDASRKGFDLAIVRGDAIGYQLVGDAVLTWNTLFAFGTGDTQFNTAPDRFLRFRDRLASCDGTVGIADRENAVFHVPDGRRNWVAFHGSIAALEPAVDSPDFFAVVVRGTAFELAHVRGTTIVGSIPVEGFSPSDWQVVSLYGSAQSQTLALREIGPVLRRLVILTVQSDRIIQEAPSGLKNFTVFPTATSGGAVSHIDLLKGHSRILRQIEEPDPPHGSERS